MAYRAISSYACLPALQSINAASNTTVCVVQKGGEKLGYESEAFAIYDTMRYIKPSVRTLCVGTAFGESAMLLATGEKVTKPAGLLLIHGRGL